jgi:molybdopterin/thiamine biosynthesis adenylyltransferase/rhodanese-related sulfurtransferase
MATSSSSFLPSLEAEMTATLDNPLIRSRTAPALEREELLRYGRHLLLPEVAIDGQRKLKAARVLIVGAGGLGSPAALYLAAAGVGTIGLVDFDLVEVTNLQRQLLYGTADVGRSKLDAARDRLQDANPNVKLELHATRLTAANALTIVREYDLVLDGTDNFATRYLVNDACVLLGKPNVYGSIFRFDGQASVFATEDGPCYRCLYPEPPPPGLVPSCAEGGVLGVLPGLVGTVQATEAIKLILGIGTPLVGRLLLVNALDAQFRSVTVRRNPTCPACATGEIRELIDYDQFCAASGGIGAGLDAVPQIEPRELAIRRAAGEAIQLLDVREPHEWEIGHIDGARLIPLHRIQSAIATIDANAPVAVYCKGGTRSALAVRDLQEAGFHQVWSVSGGILRWAREVDPDIPQY